MLDHPVFFSENVATVPVPIRLGASFYITADPRYNASDASHLVPCTNGASVTTCYEQVSKTWFTWAMVGGAGAKPVFNSSGVSYSWNCSPNGQFPFAGMWPQSDVSIVIRFTPQAQIGHYIGQGADSGNQPYTFYRSTTTGVIQRFNTGPSWTVTNGANTILSYQGTGTAPTSTEKSRVNGGAWTTVSNTRPTRAGTSTTIAVGIGGAGAGGFTNFKAMAVFPSVLSDANFSAVEAAISAIP